MSLSLPLSLSLYVFVYLHSLGVAHTRSDSNQCLNFAKKNFIQYSIQYLLPIAHAAKCLGPPYYVIALPKIQFKISFNLKKIR